MNLTSYEKAQIVSSACARTELMLERRKQLFKCDEQEVAYQQFLDASKAFGDLTAGALTPDLLSVACDELAVSLRMLKYKLMPSLQAAGELSLVEQIDALLVDCSNIAGLPTGFMSPAVESAVA